MNACDSESFFDFFQDTGVGKGKHSKGACVLVNTFYLIGKILLPQVSGNKAGSDHTRYIAKFIVIYDFI